MSLYAEPPSRAAHAVQATSRAVTTGSVLPGRTTCRTDHQETMTSRANRTMLTPRAAYDAATGRPASASGPTTGARNR
ncbi:hypothetical protein L1785_03950 [Antribacter sp. KLBMP9083]|uniref:Uncharacterized protein n=1 Tax=Antribacter soli TaxID=2910976 RepID=A0AA41QAZ9_9MICO|nr:hypothetical protein [Antribacter soli]MCF4120124.1 hypothetical protein [Antribacter soli]